MDNPDIRRYHGRMGIAWAIGVEVTSQFDGACWDRQRSAELTPLYALRYRGPRTARRLSYHTFWELIAIRSGSGALLLDGAEHSLRPGDAVLMPPLRSHTEITPSTMDIIWIGLQGSLLAGLDGSAGSAVAPYTPGSTAADGTPSGQGGPDRQPHIINDSALTARIEDFWLFAEFHARPSGIELDGMARRLLGQFLRSQASEAVQGGDRIGRVLAWLNERFGQDITVARMARESGMSEGHFHRQFKLKTGRSPMDYLNLVRLRHAEQLLRFTDIPVSEAAERSGFPDPLYFSRAFKKTWGRSPRDYRAQGLTYSVESSKRKR